MKGLFAIAFALVALACVPARACDDYGGADVFSFNVRPSYVQTYSVREFALPVYSQRIRVGYSQQFRQQQRFYPQRFRQNVIVRQRGGLNLRVDY